METQYKREEIQEHFNDFMEDQAEEWLEKNKDDLHHHAFNTDYFIIGNYQRRKKSNHINNILKTGNSRMYFICLDVYAESIGKIVKDRVLSILFPLNITKRDSNLIACRPTIYFTLSACSVLSRQV